MNPILEYILSHSISGIVIAFVLWASKLPQRLKENTDAVSNLTTKVNEIHEEVLKAKSQIDLNQKRHDITQKIISDIIDENIDTRKIIDDYQSYPHFRNFHLKPRRES